MISAVVNASLVGKLMCKAQSKQMLEVMYPTALTSFKFFRLFMFSSFLG